MKIFSVAAVAVFALGLAFASARPHLATLTSPIPPPSSDGTLMLGAFNVDLGKLRANFVAWNDTPVCFEEKTTFIYWENLGISLDSIIGGFQDEVIKTFGSKLCKNAILSLFHEMNGNWATWGGTVGSNNPAKVIAAYRHIHDIIGRKVHYAWVVNNSDEPDQTGNRAADYYPGAAYVDIVGVDGFDRGGRTFIQAISPNFDRVKGFGKPLWVTSFGTALSPGQPAWIADAVLQAKAHGIQGLIYFSYPDKVDFSLSAASKSVLEQPTR